MNVIFIAVIFFIFGATTGTIISLFIAGIGKINEEHEYYHEGFIDGYNKAEANYNMDFNNGHFKQGKIYQYRYEKEKIFVTTEEGTEQDFFYSEFNMLFTFLKN